MGLFEGDPVCRFCGQEAETVQHIICRCEAMARRRFNVFRDSVVEPKVIQVATVRDLCLFIRGIMLLNLYRNEILGLHNKPKAAVHPGQYADGPQKKKYVETLQRTTYILHQMYASVL
jgi:hypothetical protein